MEHAKPTSTPLHAKASRQEVDMAYVKSAPDAVLLDTRSKEEYQGTATWGEARLGHIPGALSLPSTDLLDEDGESKPVGELEKIFEAIGLTTDKEIIAYCTIGIRAAFVAEMLGMCGYDNVKVYTAGFSEWAGDAANPIEL